MAWPGSPAWCSRRAPSSSRPALRAMLRWQLIPAQSTVRIARYRRPHVVPGWTVPARTRNLLRPWAQWPGLHPVRGMCGWCATRRSVVSPVQLRYADRGDLRSAGFGFMPGSVGEEVVDHAAEPVSWCGSCGINAPERRVFSSGRLADRVVGGLIVLPLDLCMAGYAAAWAFRP